MEFLKYLKLFLQSQRLIHRQPVVGVSLMYFYISLKIASLLYKKNITRFFVFTFLSSINDQYHTKFHEISALMSQ